jgi:outer membrane receptor protein involved in Fe transport
MTYERSSESKTSFGNPGLKPETSTSYDLVIVGQLKKLVWDVDLFYMEISDKIVRVATSYEDSLAWADKGVDGVERWFKNVSSFNYVGVEMNAKYNFSDKFRGFLGYAFVNATNPEDDPDIAGDDPWYYKHMFNLGATYKPAAFLSLTASAKYLSDFGFGELSGSEYGPVAPAYAVFNLGVNIYPVKNRDFRFELKLDNITDQQILRPEISNRKLNTAPTVPYEFGRRFFVGMSYSF